MTTHEIDAARDALSRAEAEVNRLRAKLRAELADQDARGISAEAPATRPPRRRPPPVPPAATRPAGGSPLGEPDALRVCTQKAPSSTSEGGAFCVSCSGQSKARLR
jgi:hypothetical protein